MSRGATLRGRITLEAARLMYEEGVKQYFTAKRMAARRLLGRTGGARLRYAPSELPSNGEIREAILELAEMAEGDRRVERLAAMRLVALETLRDLRPFTPRLIGSVGSGHIRQGSDIDLHVFTDDPETLSAHLRGLRWTFETERVSILKFGEVRDYLHVHVADVFAIELTVYERRELRFRPRSSTDGRPIVRLPEHALEALLAAEHPREWLAWRQDGVITGLSHLYDEGEPEGEPEEGGRAAQEADPFGAFRTEAVDEARIAALLRGPDEDHDPADDYDPLPGFEGL